jgi:DNA modification methylase
VTKIKKTRAIIKDARSRKLSFERPFVWHGKVEAFLDRLPNKPLFDLIVTSPPYNIGKSYERKTKSLSRYFSEQKQAIDIVFIFGRFETNPSYGLCHRKRFKTISRKIEEVELGIK